MLWRPIMLQQSKERLPNHYRDSFRHTLSRHSIKMIRISSSFPISPNSILNTPFLTQLNHRRSPAHLASQARKPATAIPQTLTPCPTPAALTDIPKNRTPLSFFKLTQQRSRERDRPLLRSLVGWVALRQNPTFPSSNRQ